MKLLSLVAIFIFTVSKLSAQNAVEISDMKWGTDFNIHITFSNDSTTIQDVKALYHSSGLPGTDNEVTYYPVSLDRTFVETLKSKKFDVSELNSQTDSAHNSTESKTLWSSLHPALGGGYIHFINCLIYTFESGNLTIQTPLMMRPVSNWKPKPMTDSYRRTQKWKYYVPDNQKLAHKEYNFQLKNNELGDLKLLPDSFIELFNNTNDKEYAKLKEQNEKNKVAIIDMVRLLLGSKYLGKDQIYYIKNAVIKSVMHYDINNLPSVVIFDDLSAAVAMTLDENGYKIEKIVINNQGKYNNDEIDRRIKKIEAVIKEINEANKKVFENKLKNYYSN